MVLATDWSATAAWIALPISLLALLLELVRFVRDWTERGRADVQARLEEYDFGRSGSPRFRLVIRNYGPAVATDVALDLVGANHLILDGDQYLPIERLHPRQDFHLELVVGMGDAFPREARIRWTDRQGRHDDSTWLAVHVIGS